MPTQNVYKICTQQEWKQAQAQGTFEGNADDLRDGFIHLSTAEQLAGTLAKHFTGKHDLVVLCVAADSIGSALKWELSSSGKSYPHAYTQLQAAWVTRTWPLKDDHQLPHDLAVSNAQATSGTVTKKAAVTVANEPPLFSMKLGMAAAVLTGLLYFLAFPGIDVWPLSFVTWVPLLVALRGRTVKQATLLAWISGFTMTFVGFYWLLGMLQTFSGFSAPICIVFMLLLAAYQGGRIGLFGFLIGRATARGWWWGPICALAFAVSEFSYPLLFPWYFGATVHQVPLLTQAAELGNPIVVGLVLFGVNYAVAECVIAWRQGRRLPVRLVIAQLGVCAASSVFGAWRLAAVDAAREAAPKGRVGIVQANMGLVEKRKDREGGLKRHVDLSRELESQGPLDLIVWPETSVAGAVMEEQADATYRKLFTESLSTPTLFGAALARPVNDSRRFALLNSALMSDRSGKLVGSYAKHALLAFGEYLPFGETFPILYDWSPNTGLFTSGDTLTPLPANGRQISAHICYEDVLPSFVNEMVRDNQVDLIVNMTNDAWYGDTTQPWIHLALASFRAIEHRRDFVRATNSGVSAFVDAAGRVLRHTQTFEAQALSHEVAYLSLGPTAYELYGDTPWWLCSAALAYFCLFRKPRGRELPGTGAPAPGSSS